ncbi:alpha/beta fold hydrolase [Mesorhizobium sp. IMUNJ 23232]|uniref:alpha/beta fold hydrolase n=1 Tax=Mesorhizobium sp. IMUNJ 23232 TaxID=3376064 RepID=UPI0037A469C3
MYAALKALALAMILVFAGPALAEERWQTLPEPAPMPKPAESGYADVNGIQMFYQVFGSGEPVLLIHGGLGHGDIWSAQIVDLARDHKVIVPDSRGHGRSTRNAEPFGYDLMMSDYLALLDHLKVDKTALVGWSDGGIIGIDIAINHPERLTKLFAHAANVTTDGISPCVDQNRTFAAYIVRSGDDYRRLSKTPDEYEAFVEQMGHMWATQPSWTRQQLARIKVPTTSVIGDHDEAIVRGHSEDIASMIPGAKLVILENASHFAMLQDPEGYNKAVRDFIDAK